MIRIDSVWYAPSISRADEVMEREGATFWLWRGRGGEGSGEVVRQRMSEDSKIGNWIAGVLFERRRKREHSKASKLISDLFAAAISGALVVLLADYLISLVVPEYWPPGHRWDVAGGGATGAVLQSLWTWLKSRRKPESSN